MGTSATTDGTGTGSSAIGAVDTKLEVVVLPVSDVDRAKRFYENLGWRVDADFSAGEDFRVVQLTPHGSEASIIFGKGITAMAPGAVQDLMLVVDSVDAARSELIGHGVEVSEVFHDRGGVFHHAGTEDRVPGPDPQGRSYSSWASFRDPDGNGWLLQEIKTRLPGRVTMDVEAVAELLHETAEHHDPFEKSSPPHNWWDWYAAYFTARQTGSTPDEASAAAGRYMAEVKHIGS